MNIPSLPLHITNLLHIIVIAPLLYWIAVNRGKVDEKLYILLLSLVYIMLPYHMYRFYVRTRVNKEEQ